MGKRKKVRRNVDQDDYDPVLDKDLRKYKKVTPSVKEKLLELTLDKKVQVNKAGKRLRVHQSNAKVIVRKERRKRIEITDISGIESPKQTVKLEEVAQIKLQIQDSVKKIEENRLFSHNYSLYRHFPAYGWDLAEYAS